MAKKYKLSEFAPEAAPQAPTREKYSAAVLMGEKPEPLPNNVKTGEQIEADQKANINSTEGPLGAVGAFAEDVAGAIPGVKWAQAKLLSAAGVGSEQEVAQTQQQLQKDHPLPALAGTLVGDAAAAGMLGPMSLARSVALGAATAGAKQVEQSAHEAQLAGKPLHLEQIAHAISFQDIAEAGGLAFLFGTVPLAGKAAMDALGQLPDGVKKMGKQLIKKGITYGVGGHFGGVIGAGVADSLASTPAATKLVDKFEKVVERVTQTRAPKGRMRLNGIGEQVPVAPEWSKRMDSVINSMLGLASADIATSGDK